MDFFLKSKDDIFKPVDFFSFEGTPSLDKYHAYISKFTLSVNLSFYNV